MDDFVVLFSLVTALAVIVTFVVADVCGILSPKKVRAYRKLRRERVEMGRYFTVTCERGHVIEMTGFDLCCHLNSIGEKLQCPECVAWVKVHSIIVGRETDYFTQSRQLKDYEDWLEENRGRTYNNG